MGYKLVYVVDPDSWICLVDNVFYGFYQDFPSRNEKIHLLRWFFGIEVQQIQGLMVCFCHLSSVQNPDDIPLNPDWLIGILVLAYCNPHIYNWVV